MKAGSSPSESEDDAYFCDEEQQQTTLAGDGESSKQELR